MQLRYLQTVTEIAAENNSTTIFPIPIELFRPWVQSAGASARPATAERSPGTAPALGPGESGATLPPEIRKVLAPSLVTEGGIPHDALADMMQQLRVEWARRDPDPRSGEHG
jgi:hypothetical protein